MPVLSQHASAATTKMLLVGDTGAGKSGALASLAAAGYNLRILDFDNGLDALRNVIVHGSKENPLKYGGPKTLERIIYETLTDPMKKVGGKLVPAKATVWPRTSDLLQHWKFPERAQPDGTVWPAYDLGPLHTWGPQDILVIDSLSFLANAAMDFIMAMNGRLGGRAEQNDWFQAQQLIETVCKLLYDEGVRCNVIMNAHIAYIGSEGGAQRGYPNTLGKALSPKIGRYFNTVLMAMTSGSGQNIKQVIKTRNVGVIELKNVAPSKVPVEYPQDMGLAMYFKDVQDAVKEGKASPAKS